ncbi:MAG: cytochrome P450 [Synechococcales bacterium]|nr:cytochrome P450 [Synechococcales bacterium]
MPPILPSTASSSLPLPPGRAGLPILGETLNLLFDPQFVAKRYAQYGSIFRSHIAGRPAVYFVGPEAIEFLLSTGMDHFSWGKGWPQNFRDLLGRSLFLQDGEEHRRNRKLMMPAFHGSALNQYFMTMDAIAQQYFQQWQVKQEFEWFEEFKKLTFDIASQIFLGTAPGSETQRLSQLFTTLTDGLFGITNLPGSKLRKGLKARSQLLDYLTQVIQERRQHPAEDALSLLIQATDETGDRLSEEEIRNQALLLLFAGHETTTAMLTWFVLELGRHPEILRQARAEQDSFGNTAITLEQLAKMPVLDRIFTEVERLHPPVGGGFRGVIKPFDLNGYHIPAGWLVQYSILYTHRLPDLYPDPDRFLPDRWVDNKIKPFSLLAFGGGSRICIGLAFAKLEMRLIASYLLRNWAWQLLPNQSLEAVLIPTRRPKDGCRVQFSPRRIGS